MGVFALKRLMSDIQEVCEIAGKHMNIAMPGLLTTHATKHKAIHGALSEVDKSTAAFARQTLKDVKDLDDDLGKLTPRAHPTLGQGLQSLKDDHARVEALRALGENPGLSDVEKLANQYAKRVLGHYTDPSSAAAIAKTAYKSAIANLGASIAEDMGPEIQTAVINQIYKDVVAGNPTFGHQVSLNEFTKYVNDVKS
jgi:hypothetical protein